MNIKQVEEKTGITKQNIRFYEKEGLVAPKRNDGNGYREYDMEDVRDILMIKMLRKLGMPLEEIRLVLDGDCAFESAMRKQRESLEQEKDRLDAAIRICKEFEAETSETIDVEKVLARIAEEEAGGNQFMDIWNDFRMVVAAEEKKQFSFMPDTLIQNPREFTDELIKYANQHGKDITITKESMYPEFILNGVEYSASRVVGRYGATVHCEMMYPELADPVGIPEKRLKIMKILARLLPFILIGSLMLIPMLRSDGGSSIWFKLVLAAGELSLFTATYYVYRGLQD